VNFDEIRTIETFEKSFSDKRMSDYSKIDCFANDDRDYIDNF